MDDKKKLKTLFSVDVQTIISDTEDKEVGEAQTGYSYNLDGSIPEIAYALAGFLKALDEDEDVKASLNTDGSVGSAFITLLNQYYITLET